MIGWWKDKDLTRKIHVFSELLVFGEMSVILVFSKLLGLITCEGPGFSQSATQTWP